MTSRARQNALVILGYTAVSTAYFGLPIAAHPVRYLLGHGRDPQIFVWSFAWWVHAIETLQNPFYSRAIYAPDGINLVWATTVPGLALLFAPVTLLLGPVASYNLAAMLLPAASASTAFLLCRHVARSLWAGIVGGYLFGFSSYMLGQEQGHMHMTAVFLLPLIALAVVRYLQEEIDGRGLAWRLGVLYGLQFWLSTEVLVTASLVLSLALPLAYWLLPATRPRLRALGRPLLAAVGIAALVSAPLLYFALTGFRSDSLNPPSVYDGDLLNVILPTHFTWLGGSAFDHISRQFRGNDAEAGLYLGIPTLAIVAWFAFGARRSAVARYLLAALGLAALLTLGTGVVFRGRIEAWLPWRLIAGRPLFDNILPARFSVYASLAAAAIVALWTAGRRDWTRWAIPALAVAALVPDPSHAFWRVHPERWAFFTDQTYKVCFPRNENVAIFPFGARDDSMLWQAESGFWFRMPEGNLTPRPPVANIASDPLIRLVTDTAENPSVEEILGFVKDKKVDRILSVADYVNPSGAEMRRFGPTQQSGGVLVAPACSYSSMQDGINPAPPYRP